MKIDSTTRAFSALGHQPRMDVLRLLLRAGPDGMTPSEICRVGDILPNTLNAHLRILGEADLVTSRRAGRFVVYSASTAALSDLAAFLAQHCQGEKTDA